MSFPSILKLPEPPRERARASVFADPASLALWRRLRQIAPSSAAVLVTGETGTGKELIARELHAASLRRDRPFVAINCGALTPSLAESELFGHDRGAFTGAAGAQPGWFEAADGGTLFLDEVGELPLGLQVKLLRVLQERQVVRLGSRRALSFDVRIIAATNVDLEAAVAVGRFRADLFYRLHVARLDLLPLRARRGDILPAVAHFLEEHRARERPTPTLTDEAAAALWSYDWPGNLRQVENVVQQALLLATGDRLEAADFQLPRAIVADTHSREPRVDPADHARADALATTTPRSDDTRCDALGTTTGSDDTRCDALGTTTGSDDARRDALGTTTGSDDTRRVALVRAAAASQTPVDAVRAAAASPTPVDAVRAAAASPVDDGGDSLDRALLALFDAGLPDLHKRIEERLFRAAYRYAERNQLQAARLLGISRNIVRARLIELGEINSAARRPPPPAPDPPSTDRRAP